ncbi:MAG: hypothetical protein IT513_16010 [Burkholderiales bacterium]|nr:hypothetical protein [Burkholderiales bacterium]
MLSRPFWIVVATLCVAAFPLASVAGEAKAEPRPVHQMMVRAAEDFQSAVRSVAAQAPGEPRDQAIEAAGRALSDAQDAIAMERLLNASAKLDRSIQTVEKANPGLARDIALGEAGNALFQARRALDELQRGEAPRAQPASPAPKDPAG